jgi:hypothetical protein
MRVSPFFRLSSLSLLPFFGLSSRASPAAAAKPQVS